MAERNPTPPDSADPFAVLVARYFDGDLDDAETAELNAQLWAEPDRRREFADYGTQVGRLRELAAAAATAPPGRPWNDAEAPTRGPRRGRKRVAILVGLAAVVVVALTTAFILRPTTRPPQGAPIVAAVEPGSGDVRVVGPDGRVRAAGDGIQAGDTVRTEGPRGAAAVRYSDGTRLALVGDTTLTCSDRGGKFVRIYQGTVAASVTPQPAGSPMVLDTPAARVEVLGTEFTCQAWADRTEVSVTRGSVRVVRTTDGVAVDVPAGKRVAAAAGAEFAVESIPKRSDTWDLDFEGGLPAGLHRGRFVAEGLPPGSKGGVAAVPAAARAGEGLFEVASPEAWHQGLFAFRPDSHLHVTYAMARPGWVNLFVCARGPEPEGPHVGNYLFNHDGFYAGLRPGQWRTVSVPLAQLRRAGLGDDKPPGADEVPYLVLFSSQGDRGLVIDRVWVTRGGTGVVRYQNVE